LESLLWRAALAHKEEFPALNIDHQPLLQKGEPDPFWHPLPLLNLALALEQLFPAFLRHA
jgi:hypothetical protein